LTFEIYIHDSREKDLEKIKQYWMKTIGISIQKIKVYWKRNNIVGRKNNPDYLGQMLVRVRGERILGSKLLAISDIILKKYQRY
jgi:hypothetical protein